MLDVQTDEKKELENSQQQNTSSTEKKVKDKSKEMSM
jgi:hypothetical protein